MTYKLDLENKQLIIDLNMDSTECDAKTSDTVDSMVCPHCNKTITYFETVTRGTCDISLEPRKECADPDTDYHCYKCGEEIMPKDIPGYDMYGL